MMKLVYAKGLFLGCFLLLFVPLLGMSQSVSEGDSTSFIPAFLVKDSIFTMTEDEARQDSMKPSYWKEHFHVAAVAGVGNSDIYTSTDNQDIGSRPLLHYYVGGLVDYAPFSKDTTSLRRLFFESGITFQQKGYQVENTGYTVVEERKTRLLCLNFPLLASYAIDIEGVYVVPRLGPYFSVVLSAKDKGYGKDMSGSVVVVTDYDNDLLEIANERKGENRYRRFDCGLSFGVSVVFLKHFRGGIGYDLGFMNFQRKDFMDKKCKTKNGAFSVSFAYYFF